MRFEIEKNKIKEEDIEKKYIEILLTVKVNGEEVALNDDELSSLLDLITGAQTSYSVPVFVKAYGA